jgi:hypothetical protein
VDIFTRGVRLDDLTASRVLSAFGAGALHGHWPANFDQPGTVRATRVPVGLVAKLWVKPGAEDIDGKAISSDKGGWCYKGWTGPSFNIV